MSKEQLIDEIRRLNRTADSQFLVHFKPEMLEEYLKRLALTVSARGRASVWVRTGISPAVVTRVH
ncbi:MAG: hypothetical protein K8S99_06635 [Planctomycetes bacterium]|nr:hypothetical protein [Planctomycetota bacterium]